MPDGNEPIDRNELVYRRVCENTNFFKPGRAPPLSSRAFSPTTHDSDGISLIRAAYSNPEDAASGGYQGRSYYVIELRVSDVLSLGLTIRPDPLADEMGHAVIPEINIREMRTEKVATALNDLRNLEFRHYGPFPGKNTPPKRQ